MLTQIRRKMQMFRRWGHILTGKSVTAVKQGPGKEWSKDRIRGYYNDMTGKLNAGTLLDENGIPLTQIDTKECVHFPIAIFQYGLGWYDMYLRDNRPEQLSAFMNIARWAYEQQGDNGAWDCFSPVHSQIYTVSSMGQGEGASVLARAYMANGEGRYKAAALKAVDFMLLEMEKGGTAVYEDDALYLEEYPQTPHRSVLNGWIFSLFGLYDAMLLEPDRYSAAFFQSANTLRDVLQRYDNGYWSMYDLQGHIASPAYHDVHIALLFTLYEMTGIQEFQIMAARFCAYQEKQMNMARAISVKLWQKLTEHTDVVTVQ